MDEAIRLEGVSVRFGGYRALETVSLVVPAGAFVAVIGPNGAGKSTLLQVLLGLIRPSRGRVWLFGRPPEQVPPEWIGYVPQFKTLDRSFPALAIELVVSGMRRRWPGRILARERESALAALARVRGEGLAEKPLARLSGGELQRVYLARALVRRPRLLLLDEPATGMDVLGEADMYRLLEAYRDETGATILMITHDWEAAYHHATRVLVLNRRVIGFGPPERALTDECLRRAFGHVGHEHALAFHPERRDG